MKRLLVLFSLVVALAFLGVTVFSPVRAVAAKKTRTIIIGCTASLTGSLNVEAVRELNGLKLWEEEVNKAGGIKLPDGTRLKVALKYYDDESKKDRVQQLYTRLITRDKVNFLFSPYSSGLADAAAVIAQQYNKIMVSTGASESTYKKGYTLIYQIYTPANKYLAGAVDILRKLDPQAKKIGIIYENELFAVDAANGLKEYAEKEGFQVPIYEGYDPSTTDFAPFIDKLPKGLDAIMGGGHFTDTVTLARQLYEKKVPAKMVALNVAPSEPKFGTELGAASIYVIGPSQWEPSARYSPQTAKAEHVPWVGPTERRFITLYRARFKGEQPSYHSAGGYAGGLVIAKAIETAGSTNTKKVAAALDKMNIDTFYGHLKFNTTSELHGLQEGHQMMYVQWQKGKNGKPVKVAVWPPAAAAGKPLLRSIK